MCFLFDSHDLLIRNLFLFLSTFRNCSSPVHEVLSPLYEEISRMGTPFHVFFKIDIDNISPDLLDKYRIYSVPTFVFGYAGEIKQQSQVSTREGLAKTMKKWGIIKQDDQV